LYENVVSFKEKPNEYIYGKESLKNDETHQGKL
jgi:hypothetical protein